MLCLVLLSIAVNSRAEVIGVIYQPQNRDAEITEEEWQEIFAALAEDEIQELTFQWLQHDDETFGGRMGWLAEVAEIAQAAGLSVRLGLVWDSDYFDHMSPEPDPAYLRTQIERNRVLRASLEEKWTGRSGFAGWYLPLEISDRFGPDPATRRTLTTLLAQAATMNAHPTVVSAYFTGKMAPVTFRRWVDEIGASGLEVWVQDGRGAGLAAPPVIDLYLRALDCNTPIILERFQRTSPQEEAFRGRALSAEEWDRRVRQLGCAPGHIFSLRYHPAADGILPR